MNYKILFADDDPEIREVVKILLESEGYTIIEAADGNEAIDKMDSSINLVILDIMMPGLSGFSVCAEIRKTSTVPILFLTAKSHDSDKLMGFSSGGDDYLVKPFSYTELTARVKAMLRRSYVYEIKDSETDNSYIYVHNIAIHRKFNEVLKGGEEIILTDLEYRILLLLAENKRKIFSAKNIYESVWQEPYFHQSNNTVMVHIRNLRRKIEEDPQNPKCIVNVWGRGYRVE